MVRPFTVSLTCGIEGACRSRLVGAKRGRPKLEMRLCTSSLLCFGFPQHLTLRVRPASRCSASQAWGAMLLQRSVPSCPEFAFDVGWPMAGGQLAWPAAQMVQHCASLHAFNCKRQR